MNRLFRRRFVHCAMFPPFILHYLTFFFNNRLYEGKMVHVAEVSINCDMYSLIWYVTRKWPLAHAHLCVILTGPSFHVIELCFVYLDKLRIGVIVNKLLLFSSVLTSLETSPMLHVHQVKMIPGRIYQPTGIL